jgi:hypothetical protein
LTAPNRRIKKKSEAFSDRPTQSKIQKMGWL